MLLTCASDAAFLIFYNIAFLESLFISLLNFLFQNFIRISRVFLSYRIWAILVFSCRLSCAATVAHVYSGYLAIILLLRFFNSFQILRKIAFFLILTRVASAAWRWWVYRTYYFRSVRTLRSACESILILYPEDKNRKTSSILISIIDAITRRGGLGG